MLTFVDRSQQQTKTKNKKYILLVSDRFTKFEEFFPMQAQKAKETDRILCLWPRHQKLIAYCLWPSIVLWPKIKKFEFR